MKRIALLLSFVLVFAACGGGDETGADDSNGDGGNAVASTEGTTAPTAATTPTTADDDDDGGGFFTGDFCGDAETNEALIDGFDFLSADLETQINEWLAAIEAGAGQAPSEIKDDVALFVKAANDFAAILEDAGYDFANIDQSDPRLFALADGSLDEAASNVAEYCGWDIDDPTAGGDTGSTGGPIGATDVFAALGMTDTEVPDSVPAELVPPDVVAVLDSGPAGVLVGSTAPLDTLVAQYEEVFGAGAEVVDGVTFQGTFDDRTWVVSVSVVDEGQVLIVIAGF